MNDLAQMISSYHPLATLYSEEATSTLILIHPKGGGAQVVELDGGKAGGETDAAWSTLRT